MAEMRNHAGNEPWPSLEWASWIFDRASFVLIGSLVIGAAATVAIVWMGIVKEHHWDLAREQANERIGHLFKDGEQLKKDTAEANARAEEARLELEKFRTPRSLTKEKRNALISQMSAWSIIPKSGLPQSVAVFPTDSSFEAANLADAIASALGPGGAKWSINRYPVMYGKSFTVSGVGILTSSNSRGTNVASTLAKALTDLGIFTFVIPEKRQGCEDIEGLKDRADTDPACSSISVIVGEHPR